VNTGTSPEHGPQHGRALARLLAASRPMVMGIRWVRTVDAVITPQGPARARPGLGRGARGTRQGACMYKRLGRAGQAIGLAAKRPLATADRWAGRASNGRQVADGWRRHTGRPFSRHVDLVISPRPDHWRPGRTEGPKTQFVAASLSRRSLGGPERACSRCARRSCGVTPNHVTVAPGLADPQWCSGEPRTRT